MLIRSARPDDRDDLLAVARELGSINLATEPERLDAQIAESAASFRGERADRGTYLFVAELDGGVVGASLILAKHGTPEEPHFFLRVEKVTRETEGLDHAFTSERLTLDWDEDGPSEIGGLVLHPSTRGKGLGRPLSLTRLLYLGLHPDRFQPVVLAEMMGFYDAEGRSPLWEYYGSKLTGLTIGEADALSMKDKQFIQDLWLRGPLYKALMPDTVRAAIGRVRPETEPALAMLEAQGMRPCGQLDPFDGGPFVAAKVEDLAIVRGTRDVRVGDGAAEPAERPTHLVLRESADGSVAATAATAVLRDGVVDVDPEACDALGLRAGESVHVGPLRGDEP